MRWPAWDSRVDWGNVPTWLGTLLTVGALSVALFSAVRTFSDRQQDERRRLESEARARRSQARLITVEASDDLASVKVTNRSSALIVDLRVDDFEVEGDPIYRMADMSAFGALLGYRPTHRTRFLGPDESVQITCPVGFLRAEPTPSGPIAAVANASFGQLRQPFVTLRFTDAAGSKWRKVCSVQGSVVERLTEVA